MKDLFSLPSQQLEATILALWTAGRNTAQIAAQLGVPEGEVANMLPRILEARRQRRLEAGKKALGAAERRVGVKVPA